MFCLPSLTSSHCANCPTHTKKHFPATALSSAHLAATTGPLSVAQPAISHAKDSRRRHQISRQRNPAYTSPHAGLLGELLPSGPAGAHSSTRRDWVWEGTNCKLTPEKAGGQLPTSRRATGHPLRAPLEPTVSRIRPAGVNHSVEHQDETKVHIMSTENTAGGLKQSLCTTAPQPGKVCGCWRCQATAQLLCSLFV